MIHDVLGGIGAWSDGNAHFGHKAIFHPDLPSAKRRIWGEDPSDVWTKTSWVSEEPKTWGAKINTFPTTNAPKYFMPTVGKRLIMPTDENFDSPSPVYWFDMFN